MNRDNLGLQPPKSAGAFSRNSPKLRFLNKQPGARVNPAKVPLWDDSNGPKYLTAEKRAKLESIRNGSNMRARINRVKSVVVKKLISKYGANNEAIILSFAEEFIQKNGDKQIDSAALAALTKELGEIINYKQPSTAPAMAKTRGSATAIAVDCSDKQGENNSSPTSQLPFEGAMAWKVINAYQAALGEQQEIEQKRKNRERQLEMRRQLDHQIEVAKVIKSYEKEERSEYGRHLLTDYEKFKDEEKAKVQLVNEKLEVERKFREAQIQEHKKQKQEELESLRKLEQERLDAIQREIEAEQKKIQDLKNVEIERQKKILNENEILRLQRLEQKKIDAEYDQKLMRDYAAKMDREAEEREGAFAKRLAALDAFAKKFANEGAGKVQEERNLKEERLLLAEQERKERADAIEEARRREVLKQKQIEASEQNLRMIEEKKVQKRVEKVRDEEIAKLSEESVKQFKVEQANRARKEAEQKFRFRKVLEQQITEKHKFDFADAGMSPNEKKLNKHILNEIEAASPVVVNKVKQQLRL